MKKITTFASLMLGTLLLTACHQSPLKTEPKGKSAAFLVGASAVAERALKLDIAEDSLGGVYTECMEGKAKNTNCTALYEAMTAFSRTGKYPNFRGLTVADLKDEAVFSGLRDAYEEVLLTTELKD